MIWNWLKKFIYGPEKPSKTSWETYPMYGPMYGYTIRPEENRIDEDNYRKLLDSIDNTFEKEKEVPHPKKNRPRSGRRKVGSAKRRAAHKRKQARR